MRLWPWLVLWSWLIGRFWFICRSWLVHRFGFIHWFRLVCRPWLIRWFIIRWFGFIGLLRLHLLFRWLRLFVGIGSWGLRGTILINVFFLFGFFILRSWGLWRTVFIRALLLLGCRFLVLGRSCCRRAVGFLRSSVHRVRLGRPVGLYFRFLGRRRPGMLSI